MEAATDLRRLTAFYFGYRVGDELGQLPRAYLAHAGFAGAGGGCDRQPIDMPMPYML
jgi:hypothetical protein